MTDLLKVTEIFVNKVKKDYSQDIAIAAYYGSYASGTQNPKSDLDIFFIPATDRGRKLGDAFILEDIGMDIWPVGWDRAEGIASFKEPIVSVIADCKILYHRSQEDLDRFSALQDRIREIKGAEKRELMRDKAVECFKKALISLNNIERLKDAGDITVLRVDAFNVLTSISECLAALNHAYFKKGWGKNLNQILSFEVKPDNLAELMDDIITTRDCHEVADSCRELIDDVRKIIIERQQIRLGEHSFADIFTGYYEEMKSTFNKIIVSCENNDYPTAFYTSVLLQKDLASLLALAEEDSSYYLINSYDEIRDVYEQYEMPDLIAVCERDNLEKLKEAVIELDRKFVELLRNNNVKIKSFENLDRYEDYVNRSF